MPFHYIRHQTRAPVKKGEGLRDTKPRAAVSANASRASELRGMADVDEPSQADLVEIIQSVHTSLREKAEKISPEDLWDEHCKDVSTLAKYRVAMKKLATQHWECSAANERIEWCLCTVREYFQKGGLQRALDKDERRRKYKEKSERVTPSYNSSSAGEQDYTELETHLYSRSSKALL